ncbi:AAA family ATPase [Defluviimonas salinarum]|uniref:AAA family ATPase n=1 Tax=Defluviimonas salinarum TaxID=2992147 RepID=A0ABT3J5L3_9RHOB|nr:AAA family ATPase [Defluviimonas salinarum]MCW3782963.1 AAA family ATPase [Defluviimonas salinarum]
MDMSSSCAFDGLDPRFPDLAEYPEHIRFFARAHQLAARFRFRVMGVEHLIHELLAEPGFRSMIRSGGGDPDACRGALARAFREHAEFSSAHPAPPDLCEGVMKVIGRMREFRSSHPDCGASDALADLFVSAIEAVDGSMLAETAIAECGAASLLMGVEDTSFIEDITFGEDEFYGIETPGRTAAAEDPDEAFLPPPDSFSDPDIFGPPEGSGKLSDMIARHTAARAEQQGGDAGRQTVGREQKTAKQSKSDAEIEEAVAATLRDLGGMAARGEIDPVLGRDAEIDTVISVLRRRRKSSIILYGDAGVGKTAIAEGVALRLRDALIERQLADRPFYELSMPDLVAGTKFRGDFEARMKHLLERMRAERAILFIDEIHMLVGSGSTYGRGMDGANMFKPALARGDITVIGATTSAEMRQIRQDAALMRRFDTLRIREPDRAETAAILNGAGWTYLDHHGLSAAPEVIGEICRVTDLYQPDRRFPDKAFDLLDTACVVAVEERAGHRVGGMTLTVPHVHAAADRLGLRRPKMPDPQEMARLAGLEAALRSMIGDHHEALGRLAAETRAAALNLASSGTRASILLAGPHGAGKARIVSAFAEAMRLPLVRIDMTQLGDRGALSHLVGLQGGPGSERGGSLVEAADAHRDMVLFLEDLDRSDPSVQELLSQAIATGTFRGADGRLLSLRGAWVFVTFSTGQELAQSRIGFGRDGDLEARMREMLEKAFRKDLLAAIGCVIGLGKPGRDGAVKVVLREIEALAASFREMGVSLVFDQAAIEHAARLGQPEAIRREIAGVARDLAAGALFSGPCRDGIRIGLADTGNGYRLR